MKKKFVELAGIFLEEIHEAGTEKEVLTELGWKKTEKRWTPPEVVSATSVDFRIPALA